MVVKSEESLDQRLPDGQLVNRDWLQAHGFDRPRVDYYLRARKLEAVARGVYRRPGPPLKWQHVVYSLNEMGFSVRVGGRSALEMQGLAHYLPAGDLKRVDLYGKDPMPRWVKMFAGAFRFEIHRQRLFSTLPEAAVHTRPFGAWDWPILFSTPELAIFELLAEVKNAVAFAMADKFFESAVNLRPALLNALLLSCAQVKTKRLFLWFSQRHDHAWRNRIETENVDLGSGKRMLVKGGAYDADYQITVPREMAVGDGEQPLY